MRSLPRLPILLAATLALLATTSAPAQGTGDFEEQYALATDRAAVLEQLIPGTEDYYYYQCLHRLHAGALEEVEPLLKLWIQRHGRTSKVDQVENRRALLAYSRDPRGTFAFLRERLGLRFDHQREVPGQRMDLPTRLDPEAISQATLLRRALERHPRSLDGLRDSALEMMVTRELDTGLLHKLLERLRRPDVTNLPALVVRDLAAQTGRRFGSLPIHRLLLLDQLEECLQLRPALLGESAFLETYLQRLRPSADVDWRFDTEAREAYLERLEAFARRLPPAHNSLKAHVLHHRLVHDRAQGRHEKERFMAYLRIPRRTGYANPRYLQRRSNRSELADFNKEFATALPRIGDDEALVRAYLQHFFRSEDSPATYAEFVRRDYLDRLFAETKILYGQGDMEQWYSLLDDPAYYEQLKERVEIDFAPTQKHHFRAGESVAIDVDVKNVETLLVKVFAINTFNYYREQKREVDASINLDGLIANDENTYTFEENPLRRVRRRYESSALVKSGVYVVEFIGNGMSSRAVIHKGRLQYVSRTGSAGHVLRVLDEAGKHLREASVWFGSHDYRADDDGEIVLPFSTKPDSKTIILRDGGRATLAQLSHRAETYALNAEIWVDRESLLAREMAKILVRPTLRVDGRAASLELLEDVLLSIAAKDHAGISTTLDVRDLKLSASGEAIHEIRVPAELAELSVSLSGKVRNLSLSKDETLRSKVARFTVNGIDTTAQTYCALLGRSDAGYALDILGKNGEPQADRTVHLVLTHRLFTDPIEVDLRSDERGRVELGALEGITRLSASGFPNGVGTWPLRAAARTYPSSLHAPRGATIRVPYQGKANTVARSVASLLELRAGAFARDRFEHLALRDGFVELSGLPAGDYDLWLKEVGQRIAVRVTEGTTRGGWILGRDRLLPREGNQLLHVVDMSGDDEGLTIRLANAGENTRVHVVGTRYLPAFDPFEHLRATDEAPLSIRAVSHPASSYDAGRRIDDEYRYILERRYAKKFPGNMLRRPGLLLNPWALEETVTDRYDFEGMGTGGGRGGRRGGSARARKAKGGKSIERDPGVFANLGFLPQPAVIRANLRPDADGIVRVSLADLRPGQLVHVVAVDSRSTVYATHAFAEGPLVARDRRLAKAFDTERHYTEQKRFELVAGGGDTVIEDVETSKVETYDSLAAVFQLFATLSRSSDLQEFAFLLGWPGLSSQEKHELYSRYACHELHFFLYRKDPEFFAAVIRPYLQNKMDKTFLDEWLLEEDLEAYLEPWEFARLNAVERILLGQRIAAQADSIERRTSELADLRPIDPERTRLLFESALKRGALEEATGIQEDMKRLRRSLSEKKRPGSPKKSEAPEPQTVEEAIEVLEEETEEFQDLDDTLAEKSAKDAQRRDQGRRLYRAVEPTREYVEQNYYRTRIEKHDADLIRVNPFWRDYAAVRDMGTPFVSLHVPEAAGGFAEMMLALAVLDLPFEAGEHETEVDGARLTLRASSPLLLVRKELKETQPTLESQTCLVRQDYYRLGDRYRFVGNERFDKYVTEEFLRGVTYGCRVVLTNLSSSPQRLELLNQIPQGALPVLGGFFTRSIDVALEPYSTTTLEYHFYFPATGSFAHYPVHVARAGDVVAFAEPSELGVVAELSEADTTSWAYVSQNATPAVVVAFLDSANLERIDLDKIAWRMRDREVFKTVIDRLRDRHVYRETLWSYGLLHDDEVAAREYLSGANAFLARCGSALSSGLVEIDPIERRHYQHIEYAPLFNPRAHRYGKRYRILNASLAQQYRRLMTILCSRPRLDDTDLMSVTYYLLLQDRIEEALAVFARVRPAGLPMRLQYDYTRAYLDFFTDDLALARGIAVKYVDHPVVRWRERFQDILAHLDEAEGNALAKRETDDRTGEQTTLAANSPGLELDVEARQVTLRYQNLERCTVRYYEMDIEFLFSTNPFVQQEAGSFAYIQPNRTDTRTLPEERRELTFDLPEEFRNSNILVEVQAGPLVERKAYYANALAVQVIESYGQLKLTHGEEGSPVPRAYVKVYERGAGGQVRFHKDGYTDLRGRFDYVSLSGDRREAAQRYAILVMSEDDGALIREAAPPKQ